MTEQQTWFFNTMPRIKTMTTNEKAYYQNLFSDSYSENEYLGVKNYTYPNFTYDNSIGIWRTQTALSQSFTEFSDCKVMMKFENMDDFFKKFETTTINKEQIPAGSYYSVDEFKEIYKDSVIFNLYYMNEFKTKSNVNNTLGFLQGLEGLYGLSHKHMKYAMFKGWNNINSEYLTFGIPLFYPVVEDAYSKGPGSYADKGIFLSNTATAIINTNDNCINLYGNYTPETETIPDYYMPYFIELNANDENVIDSEKTYCCFYAVKIDDLKNYLLTFGITDYAESLEDANNGVFKLVQDIGKTGGDEPYVPEQSDGVKTQTGQTQNKVNNQGGTGDKTSETVNSKPNVPIGSVGTSGSVYVLNWNQLTKVQGEIWNPDVWESILSLNYKPGDTIQGGSLYPFNIPDYVTTTSSTDNKVVLGTYKIDFDETKDGIVRKINPVSDTKIELVENYKIDGIYGGFLDFEPYTKMTLWLPYIGFKSVSPQHIYNKTINIYYNIDFSTGQCKCILESENNPLYEWTSSMGAEISFNSSNFGQIKQNAVLGTIGAAVSIGSGIATGGMSIAGLMDAGGNDIVSTVGSTLGAMSFQSMGSTGSSLERFDPQGCYLIIECVESAAPDGYNHTKGRPSLITTQLKNLKGYTEIGVSHFEIPEATESEKNEIENIFKEGVIIR